MGHLNCVGTENFEVGQYEMFMNFWWLEVECYR